MGKRKSGNKWKNMVQRESGNKWKDMVKREWKKVNKQNYGGEYASFSPAPPQKIVQN